jgi:hypothetical protein
MLTNSYQCLPKIPLRSLTVVCLALAFAVSLSASTAESQNTESQNTDRYWINGLRSNSGSWIVTVESGAVTISRLTDVLEIPAGDQPTPDDPNQPAPTTLAGKVAAWSKAVGDPETAERLAVGYTTVADQIEQNKFSSKAQVVKAQEAVNRLLITSAIIEDKWQKNAEAANLDDWQVFLNKLAVELSKLESDGQMNTVADMQDEWRQIAQGLKITGGESINWDKLIELVMLIINLILSLNP